MKKYLNTDCGLVSQGKVKKLEAQVTDMTSSSADQQGVLEKSLASLRQEKDQLSKEKEEVSLRIWKETTYTHWEKINVLVFFIYFLYLL